MSETEPRTAGGGFADTGPAAVEREAEEPTQEEPELVGESESEDDEAGAGAGAESESESDDDETSDDAGGGAQADDEAPPE